MGQTLSNGVYLPNEGERNCYAGLASNWQILNTAVGAIAEKAPLVHTHTVSQITDFPAYGNAAGTICEGNDSRLSDARTPLSHTHTKSDVTDLLNSNFIPSANNSYDLGSSSYQWNNLYAKGYYYNGVAWGLGQNNRWTGTNQFDSSVILPTFGSSNYKNYGIATSIGYSGFNNYYKFLRTTATYGTDNTPDTSKPSFLTFRPYTLKTEIMDNVVVCNNGTNNYLAPIANNATDLGTSTNKWKTLNGINPGALSLPSTTYTGSTAITEIDRTGWVYDGTVNTYSPPVDCWLSISNGGAITVWGVNTAFGMKATDNIAIPLRSGETYSVSLTRSPDFCRIYPCLGNV